MTIFWRWTKLAIITCILASSAVRASDSSYGYIQTLNPGLDGSGMLVFTTTGSRSARPSCATLDRWTISTNTNAGQFMASAILTAWSLHKRVAITGLGNCSVWGDTETVYYFVVED
jgi:hypothetical protein